MYLHQPGLPLCCLSTNCMIFNMLPVFCNVKTKAVAAIPNIQATSHIKCYKILMT